MSASTPPHIQHLSLQRDHRVIVVAVFGTDPEESISAIYEIEPTEPEDALAEPSLDANSQVTAVIVPDHPDDPMVLGTIEGEVVYVGDEDLDSVQISDAPISALEVIDGTVVAATVKGEVLALEDEEIVAWKSEGPALHALAQFGETTWTAGEGGYLAQRAGDDWKQLKTKTKQRLLAMTGNEQLVFAVGESGAVVRVTGDKVALLSAGSEHCTGVALFGARVLIAAGKAGLLELHGDEVKLLRAGHCEKVAADDKYVVISANNTLLRSEDGVVWSELSLAEPDEADDDDDDDDDHDHSNCGHDHN